jgi:hypothetical protein
MKSVRSIRTTLASSLAARESRRAAARRAVVLPCQVVREHDFKLVADRTLDISADGLLLPLRTHVLTGESLIVSFAIPGMWIDAEATVTRVVHGRRPGDDGLAVGVVFDRISPSTRAALVGYLHARKTPLPRRGPLARLRRGEDVPQLADAELMQRVLVPGAIADTCDVANVMDVMDLIDDENAVDGLGILRAVVGAWQSLLS